MMAGIETYCRLLIKPTVILFFSLLSCYLVYKMNLSTSTTISGVCKCDAPSNEDSSNLIAKQAFRPQKHQFAHAGPIETFIQVAEVKYQMAVKKRSEFLQKVPSGRELYWPNRNQLVIFWHLFYPSFDCPQMTERIGHIGDGGKFVCGLDHIIEAAASEETRACVVYSFGVNDDTSFEEEILTRSKGGCIVRMFDPTVALDAPAVKKVVKDFGPNATFEAVGIGTVNTGKIQTLGSLMRKNGDTFIDILKIDIEGNEFATLNNILDEFASHNSSSLPFGQLQLEIHMHNDLKQIFSWMERLESAGLRTFRVEPNYIYPCSGQLPNSVMQLFEFAFINIINQKNFILQS